MKTSCSALFKLSAFTLLCTTSLHATVVKSIADRSTVQFGLATGNLLVEQTYLDNYQIDKGSSELHNLNAYGSYELLQQPHRSLSLQAYDILYPAIDTYTLGTTLAYRFQQEKYRQGLFAGFDYTHYDALEFMQAALGYEINIYDVDATMSLYLPFGDDQNYDGTANGSSNPIAATLLGMYGFELNAVKKLSDFDFIFQGSNHWRNTTKNNFLGVSLGLEYHNTYATLGALGQFRSGIDSEQYGSRLYANIPLYKPRKQPDRPAEFTKPVLRQRGVIISAKERACVNGTQSYSINGITTCQDSNPFDSALIQAAKLKAGASTEFESLGSKVVVHSSNQNITINDGLTVFRQPVFYDAPKLIIEPGAILVMAQEGAIFVGPNTELSMGGANATDKHVTIVNGPFIKHYLLKASGSKNRAGLSKALAGIDASNAITSSLASKRFPSLGFVVLGQNNLDLESGVLGNFSALGDLANIDYASSSDTSTDASIKFKSFSKDVSIGGKTDTTTVNEIHKSLFYGVPLRLIATKVVADQNQFLPANQAAIHVAGGELIGSNLIFQGTRHSETLLDIKAGGSVNIRDAIFDLSLASADTSAFKLRDYGKATDLSSMTSLVVEHSLLKGKKGTGAAAATKQFLDVPATATAGASQGNGYGFALLNSTIQSRGYPATAATPSDATASISRLGPVGTDQTFVSSNTETAATKAGFLEFYGNTFIIDTSKFDLDTDSKKDALTRELAGFGKIFTSTGNGSDIAFSRGGPDAAFTHAGTRIAQQSFQSGAWTNVIGAGSWNGDAQNGSDAGDTLKLMRYLPAKATSTNLGPQFNDAVSIEAGTAISGDRATLVSTLSKVTGGSINWDARTANTSDENVIFGGSDATLFKMRNNQYATPDMFEQIMSKFMQNDMDSVTDGSMVFSQSSDSPINTDDY